MFLREGAAAGNDTEAGEQDDEAEGLDAVGVAEDPEDLFVECGNDEGEEAHPNKDGVG